MCSPILFWWALYFFPFFFVYFIRIGKKQSFLSECLALIWTLILDDIGTLIFSEIYIEDNNLKMKKSKSTFVFLIIFDGICRWYWILFVFLNRGITLIESPRGFVWRKIRISRCSCFSGLYYFMSIILVLSGINNLTVCFKEIKSIESENVFMWCCLTVRNIWEGSSARWCHTINRAWWVCISGDDHAFALVFYPQPKEGNLSF